MELMAPEQKLKEINFETLTSTVICQEKLLTPPSSDILQCARCKELMKPPIFLLANQGNVCSICYEQIVQEGSTESAIENTALSKLLNKLYFQCTLKNRGCEKVLKYSDMLEHIKICRHRRISCPFGNCRWRGKLDHLDVHFYDSCQGMVDSIHLKNNMVALSENLVFDDVGGILYSTVGTFIYRLKVVNNKAYIVVYCSTVGAELFVALHLQKDCTYEEIPINIDNTKVLCNTVNSMEAFLNFDMTKAVQLAGDISRQPQNTPFTLLFSMKNERLCEIKNKQLSVLLCVSCQKYLKPPIYNCTTGDSVCTNCYKDRLHNCKYKKSITNTRNCVLEALTNYVTYPCKFCDLEFVLETDHELTCRYQKWSCGIPRCSYKGVWVDLKSHLIRDHVECVCVKPACAFNISDAYVHFFIVYNTVFLFAGCHYSFQMSVILIRSDVNFDFEVRLSLADKAVTFTHPCYYVGGIKTRILLDEDVIKKIFDNKLPSMLQVKIIKKLRR